MEIAKVTVSGVRAETVWAEPIPVGISGAKVTLEFTDARWAGLEKHVMFVGAKDVPVLYAGESVELPAEVVTVPNIVVKMGIWGIDAKNNIAIPTLWAELGTVRPAVDKNMGSEPKLPIWAQMLGMIGNLQNLETKAKDNLVAAINEVKRIAEDNDIDIDLSAYIKSVNGVQPDPETGDVDIDIPKPTPPYTLPIAGTELGGVKNGGNVVINEDGTMTAGAGIHVGPEPPEDTSKLWVDTDDESDDGVLQLLPSGGIVGQVLTIGESGNPVWADPPAGSAGMMVSTALLGPGYTVMDDMSLSVEIEE